jgi:trans-aconitate 2-methyltransferase
MNKAPPIFTTKNIKKRIFKMGSIREWNSDKYTDTAFVQFNIAKGLIEKFGNFKEDEKIIDLGCGDGRVTGYLAEQITNGNVTGIDVSNNMIQKAVSSNTTGSKNLVFYQKNIGDIEYSNEFDTAVSFSAMHWLKNLNLVLKKIQKAIVPGGRFFGFFYPRDYQSDYPFIKLSKSPKWKKYLKNIKNNRYEYAKDGFKIFAEEAGFKVTYLESKVYLQELSIKQFTDMLMSWAPQFDYIPTEMHEDFLEDYYKISKKFYPINDGKVSFNVLYICFYLESQKNA